MFSCSLKSYPAGSLMRPHGHKQSQLCILLKGDMVQWCLNNAARFEGALHRCGDIWFVGKNTVHSATVLSDVHLLRFRFGALSRRQLNIIGAASMSLLAVQAARACDYTLADLEQDKASGLRLEIPDCFFRELESAAAGGDPQAQLELGISFIEGLSQDPADANLGPYWIKQAIKHGHPSAKNILDSYMEDYVC